MNKEYKKMYDSIHASEDIKAQTIEKMLKVSKEKDNNSKKIIRPVFKAMLAGAAAVLILVSGTGIYTVNAEDSYVTVNSTASVGLSVNRWNKVISTTCYNEEAQKMINKLELKGMNYDEAVEAILAYENENGMVKENNELSISVDCNRDNHAKEMQNKMDDACQNYNYKCTEHNNQHNGENSNSEHGSAEHGNSENKGSGENAGQGYGKNNIENSTDHEQEHQTDNSTRNYKNRNQYGNGGNR